MSDLSENSISYQQNADIYQSFSDAEDYPGYVADYLKTILQQKKVLDLGCGNGKYTNTLHPICQIIGADKSFEQVKKAKLNSPQSSFIQADALSLPFEPIFDCIIACWMLGTLVQHERQLKAINEIKRCLATDGKIVLVENDINSEFERIRGRDKDNRTQDYNNFLLDNGFQIIKKINTYFQFDSTQQANHIFENIWGEKICFKMTHPLLQHSVVIFSN